MWKTLKDRIKRLEENNRLLTDNLVDAICIIDVNTMTFDYITPSIQKISGFRLEEYIGAAVNNRMSEEDYDEIQKAVEESIVQLEKGMTPIRTLEVELFHKTGKAYWVEIKAKIFKEKDKPLKIIGVIRDITQRKNFEIQQKKLIQDLNEALAEKERLLKENKMLQEILPICSACKRIRDEKDRWWPLDRYVANHTNSDITHTICPDCTAVLYEDI